MHLRAPCDKRRGTVRGCGLAACSPHDFVNIIESTSSLLTPDMVISAKEEDDQAEHTTAEKIESSYHQSYDTYSVGSEVRLL